MKTPEEIEKLAEQDLREIYPQFTPIHKASYKKGVERGYGQCQKDNADKLKEAVNLLDKIVENTELFFGYDVANKNSNIRDAKAFMQSLNKQD